MGKKMIVQKKHYGISIPEKIQPTCKCGQGMAISIMCPNGSCDAFWYCLDEQCQVVPFEQIDFFDWLNCQESATKAKFERLVTSMRRIEER
jgi:hypothetical protein